MSLYKHSSAISTLFVTLVLTGYVNTIFVIVILQKRVQLQNENAVEIFFFKDEKKWFRGTEV